MTAQRLRVFKIAGQILQMDAEDMDFADSSFDFIWSWGVIHHSADTHRVLQEMHRVLRPGGECTVMIYYKSWWIFTLWVSKRLSNDNSSNTAAYIVSCNARPMAPLQALYARRLATDNERLFTIESMKVYGLKSEIVPLPFGRFKRFLEDLIPDGVARLLTHGLRGGSFLVAHMGRTSPTPSSPTGWVTRRPRCSAG